MSKHKNGGISGFFWQIYNMTVKEFKQLYRDKKFFPFILAMPVIELIFLGYAATFDIKHIPIVVWDQDRTAMSRQFVDAYTSTLYFDLQRYTNNYDEVRYAVDSDEAKVAIVIPRNFQNEFNEKGLVDVQILVDGTDSNTAAISLNYASVIAQQFSTKVLIKSIDINSFKAGGVLNRLDLEGRSGLLIDSRQRVWFNAELKSVNFMVPGIVCTILVATTMVFSAMAIAREKEVGTIEQIIVTPIRKSEYIIGKLIPYIILGYIEISIVLYAGLTMFKVPFRGNPFLLYALSGLFLLTSLGLGLFISTLSNNQQQAGMTSMFIMMPMMLLSGFMFPIENMPEAIQYVTYVIPLTYFLVIVRSIFLKGVGFEILYDQAFALLFIGIIVLSLSIRRFRKRL